MANDLYFTYRGDLTAAVGVGPVLAFVTRHPEGQPTAVYRLDTEGDKLAEAALPCGGTCIAADCDTLYVGGTDRRVYRLAGKKAPAALTDPFEGTIAAVVPVSNDRLAVLAGKRVEIVGRADGKVLQSLDLPAAGTALAADRTGQWLAAGTDRGTVAVFDGQDKAEFEPAESERLHDGAVTALRFEPEELRFFSGGVDGKLLTTHARGRLEPEDKGRGNSHEDAVTAILLQPVGDRLLTGGRDAVVKDWPRAGAVKPATLKDAVGRVIALAVVTPFEHPNVAVLCDDNTVRLFPLNDQGRFRRLEEGADPDEYADEEGRFHGAIDWAKNELAVTYDHRRRDRALKQLAEWNDAASLELIARQMGGDPDADLRLQAAKLLAGLRSPRAATLLEPAIAHRDEKVRVQAFGGLQAYLGAADLKPIDLALRTNQPDVGVLAVKALEPLARADDQALARLTTALDAKAWDVRRAALAALETVFDADPPLAGLTALGSTFGDVRATALVRFLDRGLLDDPRVRAAVRRRLEDDDAGVRKVAFLLSLLARPELAAVLRAADPELHRQLNEVQRSDKAPAKVPANAKGKLAAADYDTLLQATASRALDTCLRGAKGLALLGDPRAFGLLLQLSREDVPDARVEVCRALAALGDERAVNRLTSLLYDPEASVRDAAYSALAKLYEAEPLRAAEAGLTAAAEDVRRRGLQTLVETSRRKPPKAAGEAGWDLFVRALNDGSPAVRLEAFKAALNQGVAGGGEGTVRFAVRSIHPDVRKEALTEVTAQPGEAWATPLLYEFFDDPDPALRADAFALATKKNKDIAPLEAALASRYPDARTLAVDGLIKKHTKAAQVLLVRALADGDRGVRLLALSALVDDDARGPLAEAMAGPHTDVRVRAAAALARHGDGAALQPLLALATAPEPREAERVADWRDAVEHALFGLAELADPAPLPMVVPLLDSPHAGVRKAAAAALAATARDDTTAALRSALSHADPEVRFRAAAGLADLGDGSVAPMALSDEAAKVIGPGAQFAAAVALGPAAGNALPTFLDHSDAALRTRAMTVLMLLQMRDGRGTPDHILAGLSAKNPRLRLLAAEGLEAFADPAAFRAFVVKLVNDRGDEAVWKVPADTIDALADLFASAPPQLKAKTARLLAHFEPKEQAAWNQAWAVHEKRYAGDLAAARAKAVATPPKLSAAELRELAFGAYVGLVREQGGGPATPAVGRVRQTALSRVLAIATADSDYAAAARPVLTQALGDPNQAVRLQAFEHLQALGVDKTTLGADALEAGHTDLGVKGLELLTDGTSSKDGEAVLERVMLSRTDDLATEAAKLLGKVRGLPTVAATALDAVHEPLRLQAVQWLAADYDRSAPAQQALRRAVTSRYRKVREAAALELSQKKDPAAFDALVQLLRDATEPRRQREAADALVTLGDPRAVDALLDRVENDPTGTADADALFAAAGGFRRPESADRLLAVAERKKEWRTAAFRAAKTVSGFDQPISDPDEEAAFAKAEREQHPRHPAVLARLLDRASALGDTGEVSELIPAARMSRGHDVDAILATLAASPDVLVRTAAVEAVGWRLRKRGGPADPLLRAVRHKDPATQFAAAEGLARGGRPEGLNVLLSSIEYLDDVSMRERAVLALGELGDARAVDTLLKLAGEDGHALQEAAAEAIGHLSKSANREAIFRLLERLAKASEGVACRALVGLRWFGTPPAWAIVRQKAGDKRSWRLRRTAAEQLGYDPDPATRDLLLSILRTESDTDVLDAAFDAAVRLFGPEALDPHLAAIQSRHAPRDFGKADVDVVKAVCDRADPLRVMEVFPRCNPAVQAQLEASLVSRPSPPVKEAGAALAHADDGTVRLAARLIGRAGSVAPAVRTAVEMALGTWWGVWQDRRERWLRGELAAQTDDEQDEYDDEDEFEDESIGETVPGAMSRADATLEALVWTAGRVGVGGATFAELLTARPADRWMHSIRHAVLAAVADGKPDAATLAGVEAVARGTDALLRPLAAALLAKFDPKRAAALVPDTLSDRPSFARLAATPKAAEAVKAAAAQPHRQPIVLPELIAAKDVPTLAAVARDRKAAEPARLGAVEGLGVMAAEPAEAVLLEIGRAADDDEDVRKAAWKAFRRSKRARQAATRSGATPA
jgi:ParB family chromosome partitioning protein